MSTIATVIGLAAAVGTLAQFSPQRPEVLYPCPVRFKPPHQMQASSPHISPAHEIARGFFLNVLLRRTLRGLKCHVCFWN